MQRTWCNFIGFGATLACVASLGVVMRWRYKPTPPPPASPLEIVLAEVKLKDVTVAEAAAELSRLSGVRIELDAKFKRHGKVTIEGRNMPLGQGLIELLRTDDLLLLDLSQVRVEDGRVLVGHNSLDDEPQAAHMARVTRMWNFRRQMNELWSDMQEMLTDPELEAFTREMRNVTRREWEEGLFNDRGPSGDCRCSWSGYFLLYGPPAEHRPMLEMYVWGRYWARGLVRSLKRPQNPFGPGIK